MTDTVLNKLTIGKCKKSSLSTITPEENEILLVDPQFVGNKYLGTGSDGGIIEVDPPSSSKIQNPSSGTYVDCRDNNELNVQSGSSINVYGSQGINITSPAYINLYGSAITWNGTIFDPLSGGSRISYDYDFIECGSTGISSYSSGNTDIVSYGGVTINGSDSGITLTTGVYGSGNVNINSNMGMLYLSGSAIYWNGVEFDPTQGGGGGSKISYGSNYVDCDYNQGGQVSVYSGSDMNIISYYSTYISGSTGLTLYTNNYMNLDYYQLKLKGHKITMDTITVDGVQKKVLSWT